MLMLLMMILIIMMEMAYIDVSCAVNDDLCDDDRGVHIYNDFCFSS